MSVEVLPDRQALSAYAQRVCRSQYNKGFRRGATIMAIAWIVCSVVLYLLT